MFYTVFNIIFTKMLRKLEKEYQYSNIKKKKITPIISS